MRPWSPSLLLLAAACGPAANEGLRDREHTLDPYDTSQQALIVCADGGTVLGVDVSHFQGTVNWGSVKGDNRLFGFMKATEGLTFTDPAFAANWQQTQANGVFRGAYHFFHPQDDGVMQAQYFLSVTGTDFSGDLPPVVDFEVTDGVTNNALIAQRLSDFLTTVQSQTGRTPMIYVSPSFWNNTVGGPSGFSKYPLWIANYGVSCPDVPGQWSNWAFWQWTASDTVTGISGAVDGDYFNGTLSGLIGLVDGGATSPPDAGSTPDAGTPPDAGRSPPDSGSPPADAGSSTPDSGTTRPDAGPGDAGTTAAPDSGTVSPDSGTVTPDAGRAAQDAGSGSPDGGGSSTTGNGGCGCSGSGSNAAVFLAGTALVWARRRRRPFFLRPASG